MSNTEDKTVSEKIYEQLYRSDCFCHDADGSSEFDNTKDVADELAKLFYEEQIKLLNELDNKTEHCGGEMWYAEIAETWRKEKTKELTDKLNSI